jgi:hypothetical protein
VAAVACGNRHTVASTTSGHVLGWGEGAKCGARCSCDGPEQHRRCRCFCQFSPAVVRDRALRGLPIVSVAAGGGGSFGVVLQHKGRL